MKNKFKNVVIGVCTAIFVNVASSCIYAKIKSVDFFTAFNTIWRLFIDIITYKLQINIQVWQLLLIGLVLALIVTLAINYTGKAKKNTKPEFMNYTTGVYKDIRYKWRIKKNYDNQLEICDFRPICDCGAELTTKNKHGDNYYFTDKLFCVNCDKIIPHDFNIYILKDAKLFFENVLRKKVDEHNKKLQGK